MAAAVFGGTPADPFFEGVGEGEGIVVANGAGDGVDFIGGIFKEVGGATHAEVSDLMHGSAAEMLMAKAAKMFGAATGEFGEGFSGPGLVEA